MNIEALRNFELEQNRVAELALETNLE